MNKVYINNEKTALKIKDFAAYITVEGISFENHYHGIRVTEGSYLNLKNLTIRMAYIGILIEKDSHHIEIDTINFNFKYHEA